MHSLNNTMTGNKNTALGSDALLANTTGAVNTAVGYDAMGAMVEGGHNVAIGLAAMRTGNGSHNVCVGSATGYNMSATADENTFIGLCVDEDRQSELTEERVEKWLAQLNDEMCFAEFA